ncbi:MAG: hypothetical protein NC084_09760 [Bacteroides sp.]|nr:hypothetical protein [Eubacterium sp.]MCM1419430.1 hypothetical protein [Roseburia sp.]MCM1462983.1 hypothetical protein [Bacteroides sp.]
MDESKSKEVHFNMDHKRLANMLLCRYRIFLTSKPIVASMLAKSCMKDDGVKSVRWGNANDFDEVPNIYKYDGNDGHYYACIVCYEEKHPFIGNYYEIIFA